MGLMGVVYHFSIVFVILYTTLILNHLYDVPFLVFLVCPSR